MKIIKFQTGGGFGIPIHPTLDSPAGSGGAPTKPTADKGENVLDEALIKEMINEGGLVNEGYALADMLEKLEQGSNSFESLLNPQARSSMYKKFGKINEMRQNKELWKEARNNAVASGAIGEIAVGVAPGSVYAKDLNTGNVGQVSIESVKKGKYKALTVGELLNERQYNANLAFSSNDIFAAASGAVSMKSIVEKVTGLISKLGTDSTTSDQFYNKSMMQRKIGAEFGKTPSPEQLQGMGELLDMLYNDPSDLVKIKTSVKTEKNNAKQAFNYIVGLLTPEEKRKLDTVSSLNGVSSTGILADMLATQTNHDVSETYDLKANADGTSKGATGTVKSTDKPMNNFQMFWKNSMAGVWDDFLQNDPKFGGLFKGVVGSKGPLMTKNDEAIPMSRVGDIFGNYQYNAMVDTNAVYFGNKKVSQTDFNNLIYNNQEDGGILFMPTDKSGAPDFDSIKRFKEVNAIFEQNKDNLSDSDVKKLFKKYSFDVNIKHENKDGRIVKTLAESSNIKPFFVMSAYTVDNAQNLVDNNNWLTKVDSNEVSAVEPLLNQAWTIGTGKAAVNTRPKSSMFDFTDEYYKSLVFARVKPEASVVSDNLVGNGIKGHQSNINEVQRNILHSNQRFTGPLNQTIGSEALN